MSKHFNEDEPTFVKIPKKVKPYDPDARKGNKRDPRKQQREQKRNG
jgi:hypothetical protein